MPAERVVIDIEVNSDIATIEATREALERLTNAQRRYNRERDREPSGGGGGGSGGGGGDDDGRRRGGGGGRSKGRYDGFRGKVFDFRGDMGKGIASYGKLLALVNKLSMISLPLMMGALSGIALAFQAGTYFVKMYKAAMSTLASAVGIAFVGITTLLAAQKEFAVVQNSPAYVDGNINTANRLVATGDAMSMFTENTRLAVVGAKGLSASFTTLSKVKPITGETTAAFESLMDVVAGSGGDLEGGSKKLAEFLAAVQKKGTLAGGAQAAKELGPDFEKIVKEAGALGIKTSDEFLKAAAEGQLGETFATKYAGTLDALNNTVMGRFKSAVQSVKNLMTDLGGQYLDEAGTGISRLQGIVEKVVVRLNYVLQGFNASGKMGSFLDAVDKGADKLIELMTKYLSTTPSIFGFFKESLMTIGDAFDRMQDWMRQFQAAGELINEYFFKPLFSALGSSFTNSMTSLSETIERNKGTIQSFAQQIAKTLTAIGKYGDVVRKLFIGAMPALQMLLKVVELFFNGLAKFGKMALGITEKLKSMGLGKVGAIVNIAALYALFGIASRFFKVFGTMFGKNMKQTGSMNVQAGVVNVNGGVAGGGTGPLGPTGKGKGRFGKIAGKMGGYGPMLASAALMVGGSILSGKGDDAGGYDTAGGTALKTAGVATTGTGVGIGLLGTSGLSAIGGGSALAGTGVLAIGAAGAAGAYGAGSYAASKFKDDSIKSKMMSGAVGAVGGALSGGAAGAGIGFILGGPIGAAIGAGIGAAAGAVIGGVTGFVKAGANRKKTRKAAKELVDGYQTSVSDAIAGGNIDDLLAARDKALADRNKLVSENSDPEYAAKAVAKYDAEFEKLNTTINNYTGNAGLASKYLDVGAESLNKLAEAAGIDLTAKMLNFREVVNLVGKTVEEKARLMKVAMGQLGTEAAGSSLSYFDKKKEGVETSRAVNSAVQNIAGGASSEASSDDFLEKLIQQSIGAYGDVGGLTQAGMALEEQLTTGDLKDISDKQKKYLREEAGKAGIGIDALISGGKFDFGMLAEVLGGNTALDGLKTTDAEGNSAIDPLKLKNLVETKIKQGDTNFLTNLIAGNQSGIDSVNDATTRALMYSPPGGGTGFMPLPSNERGSADAMERRANGGYTPPASTVPDSTTVSTVIHASILDRGTIDQIERAINKALRDAKERGPVVADRVG